MSRHRWAWFKRTLFGYNVMFVNKDYYYTFTHRPFRQPIMKTERTTKMPQGKQITRIIYDELSNHPFITGKDYPAHERIKSK